MNWKHSRMIDDIHKMILQTHVESIFWRQIQNSVLKCDVPIHFLTILAANVGPVGVQQGANQWLGRTPRTHGRLAVYGALCPSELRSFQQLTMSVLFPEMDELCIYIYLIAWWFWNKVIVFSCIVHYMFLIAWDNLLKFDIWTMIFQMASYKPPSS